MTISDHKPVCSVLKVKIKRTDPDQKRVVTKSIFDYLQNLKDNFTPKMKLSSKEIIFEDIRYGDTKYMQLDIENVGDGLLEFEMSRVLDKSVIKSVAWLQIQPLRGVVKAGETKSISFKIQINQREAQLLFLYKDLEEFVRIQTNETVDSNSKQEEIHVKCNYLKSCFGAALPILN